MVSVQVKSSFLTTSLDILPLATDVMNPEEYEDNAFDEKIEVDFFQLLKLIFFRSRMKPRMRPKKIHQKPLRPLKSRQQPMFALPKIGQFL